MTEGAPAPSRWPVGTWTALGVLVAGGAGAVAGDVLSPAFVLDLLALWPLAVPAVPLAVAASLRRRGGRFPAAAPLVLVTSLVVAAVLHIGGWTLLPSAEAAWTVPAAEDRVAGASFTLDDGVLSLRAGASGSGLRVDPVRRGGDAAPPAGSFRRRGATLEVLVEEREDPGWFVFAGWKVTVPPGPEWDIDAAAPTVDIDVSALRLSRLDVVGSGRVVLGGVPAPVTVAGDVTVVVPLGAPVVVTGEATVPDGWSATETGWQSPGVDGVPDGGVWAVVAGGGSVSVETR